MANPSSRFHKPKSVPAP